MLLQPSKRLWRPGDKPPFEWTQRFGLDRDDWSAQDLICCWLMNEGGGASVFDLSGNRYKATMQADARFVQGIHGPAIDFDGTGDYLSTDFDSSVLTEYTIITNFKLDAISGYQAICSVTAGYLEFYIESDDDLQFYGRNRKGTKSSSGFATTDTWMTLAVVETSADITAYKDGVIVQTSTTTNSGTDGLLEVAGRGSSLPINGQLDYFYIYNRPFFAEEIARLHREPFRMVWSKKSMILVPAAVVAEGPPLTGTSDAVSSVSGDIEVAKELTGTSDAVATVLGDIEVAKEFTGTVTAISSVSGILSVAKEMSGTSDAVASVSGVLSVANEITGTSDAVSSVSGDIEVAKEVTGTSDAVATVSGDIEVTKKFTGTITAASSVSGTLSVAKELTGTVTAAASVSGDITIGEVLITGTCDAVSSASGDIEVAKKITGTVDAVVNVSGDIKVTKELTGISSAVVNVSGTLSVIKELSGATAAISTADASLTVFSFLTASLTAASSASSPGLEVLKNLAGGIIAIASVDADIVVTKEFTGSIPGVSILSGTLTGAGVVVSEADLTEEWMWIEDIIQDEGHALTITVPGNVVDPTKPWRGNAIGTPVQATGVFVRHKAKSLSGDHVKREMQRVLIAPQTAVDVEKGTKIYDSESDSDWFVEEFQKIVTQGQKLLYILHVKQ